VSPPAAPPCAGKVAYGTAAEARAALRHVRDRETGGSRDHRRRRGNAPLAAFPCRACGQWHIGVAPQPWKSP
jgi:hypothetical protein